MREKFIQKGILTTLLIVLLIFTACSSTNNTQMDSEDAEPENKDSYTVVTEDNYGLAETEVIFLDYVDKVSQSTGTNGVGVLMHNRKGADPKDRAIMRINFDTIYSFAVVDLTEDLLLTMPETNGRYQSAWIITDEHYNPMAFVEPGMYSLTIENVGRQYAIIILRTQVNTADPADMDKAHAIQDKLNLVQKDKGSFSPSGYWDLDEIIEMRSKYQQIGKVEDIQSDVMFGKKGEVPLKEHNVGTALGWGGFTPDRAVYPSIYAESIEPQILILKDVPSSAFWSITVYDEEGFPQGEVYNINSQFAVAEDDGSYIIHFGGDKNKENYMDIFENWNLALRIYEPTESFFNGDWIMPELNLVE